MLLTKTTTRIILALLFFTASATVLNAEQFNDKNIVIDFPKGCTVVETTNFTEDANAKCYDFGKKGDRLQGYVVRYHFNDSITISKQRCRALPDSTWVPTLAYAEKVVPYLTGEKDVFDCVTDYKFTDKTGDNFYIRCFRFIEEHDITLLMFFTPTGNFSDTIEIANTYQLPKSVSDYIVMAMCVFIWLAFIYLCIKIFDLEETNRKAIKFINYIMITILLLSLIALGLLMLANFFRLMPQANNYTGYAWAGIIAGGVWALYCYYVVLKSNDTKPIEDLASDIGEEIGSSSPQGITDERVGNNK